MSSSRQRRHVDDFEARRAVAQQPQRAGRVAAGQHEAVAARRQAVDEVVQHAAQTRKAFERPELEELVEQERGRLAAAASARASRNASVASKARAARRPARRRRAGTATVAAIAAQEPFRRGRGPLDVDVLRRRAADPIAELLQQRRAAAAASAERAPECATAKRRARRARGASSVERGVSMPCLS